MSTRFRIGGAILLAIVCLAIASVALGMPGQRVYLENRVSSELVVEELALTCDRFEVGRLERDAGRQFTFFRSCRGEAAYEVRVRSSDGQVETASACYVDRFPSSKTVSIQAISPLRLECHSGTLRRWLLNLW